MKLTLYRKNRGPFVVLAEEYRYYDLYATINVELDSKALRQLLDRKPVEFNYGLSEWDDTEHYIVEWLEPASWLSLLVTTGISKEKLLDMIEEKQYEVQAAKEQWEVRIREGFAGLGPEDF